MELQFEDENYQKLAQCVKVGDYHRLEDLWLEICGQPDVDTEALCRVAEELADKRRAGLAGTLLKTLLEPFAERSEQGKVLDAVKLAARYSNDAEDLREFAVEAYSQALSEHSGIQAALDMSGIRGVTPLKDAINQMDELLFLDKGDYVFHDSGWGVGKIDMVNIPDQSVIVDFCGKPGHRVSSRMATKILRKLPDDDFEVLCWTDMDRLKKMAEEEPAKLLRSVLKSAGKSLSSKDIKARLLDVIIDKPKWSKWWSAARREARKDSYLKLAGQQFTLRTEPLTQEEEAVEKMREARKLGRLIEIAVGFLKKSDQSERSETVLKEMAGLITEACKEEAPLSGRIEVAFLLDDIREAGGEVEDTDLPSPAELIASIEDFPETINSMSRAEFRRRALEVLAETKPDEWPEIYGQVLFDSPRDLWDFIIKRLLDSDQGKLASDACLRVAGDHSSHAELYLWLCRAAFRDRFESILGEHDEFVLLENLLSLLDELADPRREQPRNVKKLIDRGKDVLSMKSFEHIEKIIKSCTPEEAQRIRDMVAYNRGLSEPTRRALTNVLMQMHASLFEKRGEKAEEDKPIFTTPGGLKRVQDEYDNLMNVQIPANQEALGTAIGFGDVSDNAELRAAREEQASLSARADRLATQMRRAIILDRTNIKTDAVRPGTRVKLRNLDTGNEECYSVLGPWDADPEKGVISHLAPLAQALMEKSVGESAEARLADELRRYEVLEITQATW